MKRKFDTKNLNLKAIELNTKRLFGGCHCRCCRARYAYKQPYKKIKRLFRRESAYVSR